MFVKKVEISKNAIVEIEVDLYGNPIGGVKETYNNENRLEKTEKLTEAEMNEYIKLPKMPEEIIEGRWCGTFEGEYDCRTF
jgi:hypothetical protein